MPKRVSLKGKGADLFFGDYAPETSGEDAKADPASVTQPPEPLTSEDTDPPARMPPSQHASKHAGDQATIDADHGQTRPEDPVRTTRTVRARQQASGHASTPRSTQVNSDPATPESESTPTSADIVLNAIWAEICQQAPVTGSFRYTDRELAALTDATYELSKRFGVKFSKQDVARLSLNAILWDYQSRGDASLLAAFVRRKKRQRGGQ